MKFMFVGHCHEDNHDKVWACIELRVTDPCGDETNFGRPAHWTRIAYATVWGRRGKALQFKCFEGSRSEANEKIAEKQRKKGYLGIAPTKLSEVYPEFEQDLKASALWAQLSI